MIEESSLSDDFEVTARSEDGNYGDTAYSLSITGIQFHPESIATEFGKTILKNFLDLK